MPGAFQYGCICHGKWFGPARDVILTLPKKWQWRVDTVSKRQYHPMFIFNLKRASYHINPMLTLRKYWKDILKVWYLQPCVWTFSTFFLPHPLSLFLWSLWLNTAIRISVDRKKKKKRISVSGSIPSVQDVSKGYLIQKNTEGQCRHTTLLLTTVFVGLQSLANYIRCMAIWGV